MIREIRGSSSREPAAAREGRDIFPILPVLLSLAVQFYFLFAVFDPRLFFYKYWELALRLRGLVSPPLGVFYSSPLYTGVVALFQSAGFSPFDLGAFQSLLGALNCSLVYRIGLIAFDRWTARLASLSAALCLPLVVYTPSLLPAVWVTTFNLVALYCLLSYFQRGCPWLLAAAGLALGLSIVTHPPGAAFLLLAAFYLYFVGAAACPELVEGSRRDPRWPGSGRGRPSHNEPEQSLSSPIVGGPSSARSMLSAAIYLLAAVLVVFPILIYNYVHSREIIPVTASGGWVFYCSNNDRARGLDFSPPAEYHDALAAYYARSDGPRLHYIEHLLSRAIAEQRLGRALSPREASRYWLREGLRFIREEPRAFLVLLARKALSAVNGYEPHDVPEVLEQARRIAPYPLLSLRVILPLALAGMIVCRPRGRGLLLLYPAAYFAGFLVAYALPRYRYPLVPVLVLFAAGAAIRLVGSVREQKWKQTACLLLLIAVFGAVCNFRTAEMKNDETIGRPAFLEEWKGLTALSERDRVSAADHFRAALRLKPDSRLSREALVGLE